MTRSRIWRLTKVVNFRAFAAQLMCSSCQANIFDEWNTVWADTLIAVAAWLHSLFIFIHFTSASTTVHMFFNVHPYRTHWYVYLRSPISPLYDSTTGKYAKKVLHLMGRESGDWIKLKIKQNRMAKLWKTKFGELIGWQSVSTLKGSGKSAHLAAFTIMSMYV